MIDIEDYIQTSRESRRTHLDLSSPCDERGGGSKDFRGLLAHYLGTSIPSGYKINLCHACNNDGCSNVKHLYWGTSKDNHIDRVERGTATTFHANVLAKHGKEGMKRIAAKAGKSISIAQTAPPEHWEQFRSAFEGETFKRGWYGRVAEKLNVSPTHVRRIAKKLKIIPG